MTVSMGEDVAEIVSGAASWVRCAHTLQIKRKRKEVKNVSLIVVVCFVSLTMRGERKSLPTQMTCQTSVECT